jgi:mRNA-degrading endonuclease RelE of RelBE toxin-antitoxin system
MRIEFKPKFERSIKSLSPENKEEIIRAAVDFIDVLSMDKGLSEGLGLKRLKGSYWEIRKGLKIRILFRWEKDLIEFVLAGNHEDVKRFLKTI